MTHTEQTEVALTALMMALVGLRSRDPLVGRQLAITMCLPSNDRSVERAQLGLHSNSAKLFK